MSTVNTARRTPRVPSRIRPRSLNPSGAHPHPGAGAYFSNPARERATARRLTVANPATEPGRHPREFRSSRIRPLTNPNGSRNVSAFSQERDVAVVAPLTYDDSRRITDLLRSNRAVVLSTLDADPGLARRLVDFTAGTAYAVNAKIEMLIRGVYLISPQGMHLGPEAKERLRAQNYHSLDLA